ncbi:MAG: pilus assembly protein TadB [Pseudoclavibacter sp.]|nr:pilus assembly protein TadB [Pseudoclavibacter sp.]
MARRIRAGRTAPEALREEHDPAWRSLGAAWWIAERCGAPLSEGLEALAGGLRGLAAARREVLIARSGPVATARIVSLLPIGGIALGAALGFDTASVLLGDPAGAVCLGAGLALMLLGALWSRRLVRGADPEDAQPGLAFELVALGMGGGSPSGRVLAEAERAARAFRLPGVRGAPVRRILSLASEAGVPVAGLLRREAAAIRASAAAEARLRAERLGVSLLLPLGACTLPAFIALGVVPIVLSIMRSAFGPPG